MWSRTTDLRSEEHDDICYRGDAGRLDFSLRFIDIKLTVSRSPLLNSRVLLVRRTDDARLVRRTDDARNGGLVCAVGPSWEPEVRASTPRLAHFYAPCHIATCLFNPVLRHSVFTCWPDCPLPPSSESAISVVRVRPGGRPTDASLRSESLARRPRDA